MRVHRANERFVEQPMKAQQPDTIEVSVTFPAIREGDLPQLIAACGSSHSIRLVQERTALTRRQASRA